MATTADGLRATDTAVLDLLRESALSVRSELADQLLAVVHWADLHPGLGDTSILGADERPGGAGTPAVAAFTAEPLGHALGVTPRAAQALLADTLDLRDRLPRTWEQVHALLVPVTKARRIAVLTRDLTVEGAEWVDRQLLGHAASMGVTGLDRLIKTAVARFSPEVLAEAEARAHASWDVQVVHPRDWTGTSMLRVVGDTRAIVEMAEVVRQVAEALPESDDTAGQRRFHAFGSLFAGAVAVDVEVPRSKLRLYAYLDVNDLLADTDGVGTVEGLGPVTIGLIKQWCGDSHVTVVPVLDLADVPWSPRHDPPPRVAEQVVLRDQRCVFPHCTTPARLCDLDHIKAWKPADRRSSSLEVGTQFPSKTLSSKPPPRQAASGTTPLNLAPLCRRHHRLKTLGLWRYERLPEGGFWWEGPHGQTAMVTHHGTATLP